MELRFTPWEPYGPEKKSVFCNIEVREEHKNDAGEITDLCNTVVGFMEKTRERENIRVEVLGHKNNTLGLPSDKPQIFPHSCGAFDYVRWLFSQSMKKTPAITGPKMSTQGEQTAFTSAMAYNTIALVLMAYKGNDEPFNVEWFTNASEDICRLLANFAGYQDCDPEQDMAEALFALSPYRQAEFIRFLFVNQKKVLSANGEQYPQTLESLEKTLYAELEGNKAEVCASDESLAYDVLTSLVDDVAPVMDSDLINILSTSSEMGSFPIYEDEDFGTLLAESTHVSSIVSFNVRQYLTDKALAWQQEHKS